MIFLLLIISFLPFLFCIYPEYIGPTSYSPEDLDGTQTDDFATCTCDLTYGQCDARCCCDPDCNTKELEEVFIGDCVSQKVRNLKCSNKYSFGCLLWESSFLYGNKEFFPEPKDVESLEEFEKYVPKLEKSKTNPKHYTFLSQYEESFADSILSSGSGYFYDDLITVNDEVVESQYNLTTFLTIPPVSLGCDDVSSSTKVKFGERNYYSSSCSIAVTDETAFENLCQSLMNIDRYKRLFIRQSPSGEFIAPSVESVGDGGYGSYNSTEQECTNGLREMQFYLRYDESTGRIEVVEMYVTDSSNVAYTGSGSSYSVEFEVFLVNMDMDVENITHRVGAPGYQDGGMLMAGRRISLDFVEDDVTTTKEAVIVRKYGLEVLSGGDCSELNIRSIRFGEDFFSSCRIRLTHDELQSLCQKGFLYDYINQTIAVDRIGRFGDADQNNIDEWISVHENDWNQLDSYPGLSDGVCEGIITDVKYVFLTTMTGNVHNPQMKIYGVKRIIESNNWEHKELEEYQDFWLRWGALFVDKSDVESSLRTVGTGIQLKPLPKNSLAPFQLDN